MVATNVSPSTMALPYSAFSSTQLPPLTGGGGLSGSGSEAIIGAVVAVVVILIVVSVIVAALLIAWRVRRRGGKASGEHGVRVNNFVCNVQIIVSSPL